MTKTLWIVIYSQHIADKARENLESGQFATANETLQAVKGFQDQLQSICQQHGGHVHALLPEWTIIEGPSTVAESVPYYVEGFNEGRANKIAVGIGLDFNEAVKAMQKSRASGDIELYEEDVTKSEETRFSISPNLFDVHTQARVNSIPAKPADGEMTLIMPTLEQQVQMQQQMMQITMQNLGATSPEQQQQQQAQQQAQQQQPRDLVEALHGGQVQDRNPYRAQPQQETKKEEPDATEESPETDEDDVQDRLGGLLLQVKSQIPQLISLAEKNPEAFKQSMSLVQKLLTLAHKNKKNIAKRETEELTQLFNETLEKRVILPVGTVKNRKKKVLVNGKARWRSMISGQVKDQAGQAISVKSSNAQSQDNNTEEQDAEK